MDKILFTAPQTEPNNPGDWSRSQKIAFRFFFIFLGIQTLVAYNSFFIITDFTFYSPTQFMDLFSGLLFWMDRHFFHFGYNPDTAYSYFGDPVFGWLFLILIFFTAVIATLIWTVADRKRRNYHRLHYWFLVYLSYYLFIALTLYGVVKIIPVQMPYPNVDALLTPIGNMSRFGLLWTFIGASPGYAIFTGICEFTGALLLLFRRTRVFGSLFLATVLINVVLLNVFYNVMVKLLSMHLLVIDLFLLAPYVPRLVRFFYFQDPVSLREKQYTFSSAWKKYVFILLLLAPAWVTYKNVKQALSRYDDYSNSLKNQKLYEVTSFMHYNDTIPALMNDSLVWRKFTLTSAFGNSYATVYHFQDRKEQFIYDLDSVKRTIAFHSLYNTWTSDSFYYESPRPDQFILTGLWKGVPVKIIMKQLNIDSIRLNKEKISWIYHKGQN
jgi:hypothetical protein